MNQILDDHSFDLKPIIPKPDKRLAFAALVLFLILFSIGADAGVITEKELREGSYIWMPFLVTGVVAFFLPPKRAILLGILTVPATFLFHETLRQAF